MGHHTPLAMPKWLLADLPEHLSSLSSDFDNIVAEFKVMFKGKVLTVSAFHAWLVHKGILRSKGFSYVDPCPTDIDVVFAGERTRTRGTRSQRSSKGAST